MDGVVVQTLPEDRSTTVRPGALTALLGELARAPGATGWSLPAQPGDRIGRFEIVRELGRGGFGVVYEAKDTELGRSVAFKAIRAGSTDAAREQRALAEAEAAARLAHPNIVHLYDVGRCDRGAFLIMELLRGEPLDERLARGPLKLREAVRVAVEIAHGLAHAHVQGVVHRDLKPGNVFLCEDGQVKVLDFGLAHVFGRGGMSGGTPAYMAPEQARGEASDERADVYALGVIVHELVAGTRPHEDGERGKKTSETPRAPAALSRLVARMLARDPEKRPASGREVHAELAAIRRAMEPRRLVWMAWTVAAAALLIAAGVALWYRPLPPGRLLAAIADTANTTGDPDLDGTSELLRAALEQSRRLSVMARSRVVNALRDSGEGVPERIDEGHARRVGRRLQAHIVIVPAVVRHGSWYGISARAVDVSRGETLFTTRDVVATKSAARDAIEGLSRRIREALHEEGLHAAAPGVPAGEIAPADPEAWSRYAEGQRLESEGRYDEALASYRRAAALEPEFPLPRLAVLDLMQWGAAPLESRKEDVAALRRNVDRLPPKDRSYAELVLLEADRDGGVIEFAEFLAHLDRQIERWPEDPRPYVNASWILLEHEGDVAAARPYVEKASALAPPSAHQVIDYLVALDLLDEALTRARRWTEEAPGPLPFLTLAAVHRARGETREALEAARRSLAAGNPPAATLRFAFVDGDAIDEYDAIARTRGRPIAWLTLRGKVREALAATGAPRAAAGGGTQGEAAREEAAWAHWARAKLMFTRGDAGALWTEVEGQFRSGGSAPVFCHAWLLAALGDQDHAARLETGWVPRRHVCLRVARLLRQWKSGDREGALGGFAGLAVGSARLYRGEILAELGRDREAVEEFRLYRRRLAANPFENLVWNTYYPRSLYLEAAALERLGEVDEARKVVGRLLHLWEDADPDLPYLREAKALGARLGAGRTP